MVSRTKLKFSHPQVSVLMPAYNAEYYISTAINSILKQTYKNFEFIILDDASTDNTWQIIKKFEKKDKRIKAYHNNKNLYIAASRNKLLKLARGKYIAWQDADDISLRDRLEKQVIYLENHPEVGIVGGFLEFYQNKRVTSVRRYKENDSDLRRLIFRYSPVAQPAAMIRKQCFNEVGIYNLKYPPAEDIDMSFRIGSKWKFANIQKPVIRYRILQESATFKKLRHQFFSTIEIRNKFAKNKAYKRTFLDVIINYLQIISIYILPPRFAIAIFIKIRNTF